jgi:hypothetical protein
VADGGTITGAPTFSPVDGVTLDGVTDYLRYEVPVNLFARNTLSYVIEFTPDFNYDSNVTCVLIDSTNGNRFLCYKLNNAGGNLLRIYNGLTTSVIAVAPGVYGPVWRQGQRNTLVLASTSGAQVAYLNGTLIGTAAVAWAAPALTQVFVGASASPAGTALFDGTIHNLKFFHARLTNAEAQLLSYGDGRIWKYTDDYVCHLPMDLAHHDPVNNRTLDISGNGNHARFGDGVTPAQYPVKNTNSRGYSFDGVAQYLYIAASTVLNKTDNLHYSFWMRDNQYLNPATFDMVLVKWPGSYNPTAWGFFLQNGAADSFAAKFNGADGTSTAVAVNGQLLDDRQRHMVTVTFSSGTYTVYVDGVQRYHAAIAGVSTTLTDNAANPLYIGGGAAARYALLAMISDVTVGGFLSPLQVMDKYHRELSGINKP